MRKYPILLMLIQDILFGEIQEVGQSAGNFIFNYIESSETMCENFI